MAGTDQREAQASRFYFGYFHQIAAKKKRLRYSKGAYLGY